MKIRSKEMLKFYSNVKHRTRGVTSKKIRRAKRKMKKNLRMIKTEDEKKIKNDQNGKRKE
jgi:hypothetical protein